MGNHPLVDGNKCTGLLATLFFLQDDGIGLPVPVDDGELFDLVLAVATHGITSVPDCAQALRRVYRCGPDDS